MSDDKLLLERIEQQNEEIKRLKSALSEEKLRALVSSEFSEFGLWEYEPATDTFCKYEKSEKTGRREVIKGLRSTILSRGTVCTDDLPAFNGFCDALKRGDSEVMCEVRVVNAESEIVWLRYEGKAVVDENGFSSKYVGRVSDITAEKGAVFAENAKKTDPVTGTYTIEAFRECIAGKRSGANRYANAGMVSVAIDSFREICAKNGDDYGDYLQKTIAKILIGISVCERDSSVTRVRGGEFLIYLAYNDVSALGLIAKRILNTVREYPFDGAPCTVSVGVSIFKNAAKPEEVCAEAMTASSEALRSGGNCYMSWSPAMTLRAEAEQSGESVSPAALTSGAAKVFDLILKAFCSDKNCAALMKEAFKTAGEIIGASNIYVYSDDDGAFMKNLTYNASGASEENCPRLVITCSDDEMRDHFGSGTKLRVHSGGDRISGVYLENGAVCAECRAIRCGGTVREFFAIIFNSSFELNSEDMRIIDALESAVTQLYADYSRKMTDQPLALLHKTIAADHRMEGFSLIPGKFIVDLVGNNAADHYGLLPGDVCYKKMRGLSVPCENCPAVKLDRSADLFASSACYDPAEHRWLNVTASIEENNQGERRYFVSSTDITDCLGNIKMSDSLTGIMSFDMFSAEAMRMEQNDPAHRFTIVMNVADFRRINEERGYETGNSILIAIADILRNSLCEGELCGRSEGSRFVALLKGESVETVTERLNALVAYIQKEIYARLKFTIYLLVGAYDMESDNVGVMGSVDRAIRVQKTVRDKAYYHENVVVFYNKALREKIKERRFIEANMFSALENNEFKVFYQPKISIATGKVVGAEALCRWIRPDGEIISPAKFVPIFEENGFITDMDFAIYRRSVADIKRWLRMGLEVPLISLNVSRHHLGDESFCGKLNSLIDSIGVPHKYIELEITESLLTEQMEKLIDTVSWFKDKGFRISVDDFGSGYSSLNLITMLPFDTLKIDGGFFLKNDLSEKNKKVITSVVTLAKSLNLETVSEGVETQPQVDFLRELGCDMIQGFFYYKPMPCEEFEKILIAQSQNGAVLEPQELPAEVAAKADE